MTTFNEIQTIKRRFFAFRNGVIADNLRKSGSSFRIIFGLNLPQLKEIAAEISENAGIALQLWHNSTTRESMLLAPMIFPIGDLTDDIAEQFIESTPDAEVADILCHFLLKRADYRKIISDYADSENPMARYISIRLAWQLRRSDKSIAKTLAKNELARNETLTSRIARQLLDEVEFLD